MEQNVRDELIIKRCYRINTQFLICLEDIFRKYDNEVEIELTVVCGKVKYTFDDIKEFLDAESTFTSKIEKLQIRARFPISNTYRYNEVSASFSDENEASVLDDRITFDFSDPNGYLVIKNQIETLLKNYKLAYSFFARTKLMSTFSMMVLGIICVYTDLKNIIFPRIVQHTILVTCLAGAILPFLPPVHKMKRFLFPKHEFEFGVNKIAIEKARNGRNVLGTCVVLAFIVGIMVNFVSSFLF